MSFSIIEAHGTPSAATTSFEIPRSEAQVLAQWLYTTLKLDKVDELAPQYKIDAAG